jgi:hypothetical protein
MEARQGIRPGGEAVVAESEGKDRKLRGNDEGIVFWDSPRRGKESCKETEGTGGLSGEERRP